MTVVELKKKISIVVAVYQNEGSLSQTHTQISALFSGTLQDHELEIIFVNDGSTDGSLEELRGIHVLDSRVKVISFTRNFGQMAAMLAGFAEASGNAIVNISADLQDPIDLIPEMVKLWHGGSEVVVCYRTNRSDPLPAKALSWIGYSIIRVGVPEIPRGGFDYVLMDRVALDQFNAMDTRHRFFQGDLLWPGYRTSFIPYERLKRTVGRSQYNFAKKLKNFTDAVLDSSYLPIRLMSLAGVLTSLLGLLYALSIVVAWFLGSTPFEGWAPIMMVILTMGGILMFMIGIIGEYVWRINEEVRRRPNYIIRERLDEKNTKS